MQRLIKVDGNVRTDPNYPAGFMGKFIVILKVNIWLGPIEAVFAFSWAYDSQYEAKIESL